MPNLKRNPSSILTSFGGAALAVALMLSGCTASSPPPAATATSSSAIAASVQKLLASGIAQANAGKLDEAKVTFENVLLLDKGSKFAYFNLGVIADAQGDTDTALANYGSALSSDPKYTPAMYNKAIILESRNQQQALALYQQIVAIKPDAATAYLRMSFLLDALKRTDEAATARAKAVALDPSLASITSSPTPGK